MGSWAPAPDCEEALLAADDAYYWAVKQRVDLRRTPCIYAGQKWAVVVDVTGKRSFRDIASECPGFDTSYAKHAVVLDRNGEVLAAR